jgi:hypothetical protein
MTDRTETGTDGNSDPKGHASDAGKNGTVKGCEEGLTDPTETTLDAPA